MVLMNLFAGKQWRDRHREQTYGYGETGGRRGWKYMERCQGPAPAGSRGTLRMNSVGERETRRTGLDRAKSARERERKKETRPGICSRVWQLLYFLP